MDQDWQKLLFFGAEQGYDDLIGHALKNGANLEAVNEQGCTPFLLAVIHRRTATIRHLLYRGVDLHATLPNGQTALMLAAQQGYSDVLKILMDHGAANSRKKTSTASDNDIPSPEQLASEG